MSLRKMTMKMKRRTNRKMTKIATLMGLVNSKNLMKRKMRKTTMMRRKEVKERMGMVVEMRKGMKRTMKLEEGMKRRKTRE